MRGSSAGRSHVAIHGPAISAAATTAPIVVVGGLEVVLAIGLVSGLVPALIAVSAFLVTLIYAAHAFPILVVTDR